MGIDSLQAEQLQDVVQKAAEIRGVNKPKMVGPALEFFEAIPIPKLPGVAIGPRSRAYWTAQSQSVYRGRGGQEKGQRSMGLLSEIFSWWGGNTWGTRMTIARQGRLVGEDELGNKYYEQKAGVGPVGPLGRPRRWVTYKDLAEASKVTPDWHGWLHYTVEQPPNAESYRPKHWQKAHRPNMTGTRDAYRPEGSIAGQGHRPKATGDYKPWQPS